MLNVWVANMAKMFLSGGQRQNGKKGVAAAAAALVIQLQLWYPVGCQALQANITKLTGHYFY